MALLAATLAALTAVRPAPAAVPKPEIDLAVTKAASVAEATPGGPLTYTVTISNAGPSGALAVVVEDTLPAAVTFTSAAITRGSCAEAGGIVTCSVGPMLAGDAVTLTVDVAVAAGATGDLVNTVVVRNEEPPDFAPVDTDPANDQATVSTPIPSPARLAAALFDAVPAGDQARLQPEPEPEDLRRGDLFWYVFAITNTGGSPGSVGEVRFTLDPRVRIAAGAPSCPRGSQAGRVVTCPVLEPVPAGGVLRVALEVQVIGGEATTVSSEASVPGRPDLADSEPTPINGGPPPAASFALRALLSPPRTTIPVGGTAALALRLDNVGAGTATGIVVALDVPAGLELLVGTTEWAAPALPSGGSATLPLTLLGARPGGYTVGATVVEAGGAPASGPAAEAAVEVTAAAKVLGATLVAPAGQVFDDLDGDGVRDAGEAGIRGLAVQLIDAAGTAVAATVTGADGRYVLGGVPPGHRIEVLAAGFVPTTPATRLVRGGAIDFGLRAQETIPATGFESGRGVAAGLALLGVGAALVVLVPGGRRRRRDG